MRHRGRSRDDDAPTVGEVALDAPAVGVTERCRVVEDLGDLRLGELRGWRIAPRPQVGARRRGVAVERRTLELLAVLEGRESRDDTGDDPRAQDLEHLPVV